MSNLPLLLLGFATGVGVLQLQAALPRWPVGIMAAALFALVVATRAARGLPRACVIPSDPPVEVGLWISWPSAPTNVTAWIL